MSKNLYIAKIALFSAFFGLVACDDDNDPQVKQSIRTSIDYTALTAETDYVGNALFVDAEGTSTVDVSEGNAKYSMFKALNDTIRNLINANEHIDAELLSDMFSNVGDPFKSTELNALNTNIYDYVASSREAGSATETREFIDEYFTTLELASHDILNTASAGSAGKVGTYLVDADGIEMIQVIQKSLIGALQLDYIGNVLLAEGLTAENYETVSDKNYTALEHNWDIAYGLFTLNDHYAEDWTAAAKGTVTEFAAGSYVWEYNKTDFPNIHAAFLKGRAAIVNNDAVELATQATFIRSAIEKAIANAAIGYLEKYKAETGVDATAEGKRVHAIGEGLGFIYSLRFADINGTDATFSQGLINDLIGSENGYWDLNNTKIQTAIDAIKAEFGI
jgi:hypothetical protein